MAYVDAYFSGLISRVTDFAKRVVSATARIARDDIVAAYQEAINMFYSDYTPSSYKRLWELNNTFLPLYRNSHGLIAYAGITITADNMSDNYKDPPIVVLNTALQGMHGYSGPITAAPSEHLLTQINLIVSWAQSYVDQGVASAGGI